MMAKAKKPRGPSIDTEKFVRAYVAAASYAEVAKVLGIQEHTVIAKFYNLKKHGIKLKAKEKKRQLKDPTFIERMNTIIGELSTATPRVSKRSKSAAK